MNKICFNLRNKLLHKRKHCKQRNTTTMFNLFLVQQRTNKRNFTPSDFGVINQATTLIIRLYVLKIENTLK